MPAKPSRCAPPRRRAKARTPASSRLVTAAQTAKAPFIRMADRYALLLLPVTLGHRRRRLVALRRPNSRARGARRGDALSLILAAPAAFIGGLRWPRAAAS